MSCQEYLEKYKEIQSYLLDFIENDANGNECFYNLNMHLITKIAKQLMANI